MNSRLTPDAELKQLAAALDAGTLRRFAIANPEHAPYGRAAREALERAGLWSRLEGRLLLGENAAQAAQFAASGSADGGIIPLSLALAPALAGAGRHVLIAEGWHQPLRQRVVLLKGAGSAARRFYEYVQQPAARAILARYGFQAP
jgi:molybdate transport system substrate-binding protein